MLGWVRLEKRAARHVDHIQKVPSKHRRYLDLVGKNLADLGRHELVGHPLNLLEHHLELDDGDDVVRQQSIHLHLITKDDISLSL